MHDVDVTAKDSSRMLIRIFGIGSMVYEKVVGEGVRLPLDRGKVNKLGTQKPF
jgi:hypothetical protein